MSKKQRGYSKAHCAARRQLAFVESPASPCKFSTLDVIELAERLGITPDDLTAIRTRLRKQLEP